MNTVEWIELFWDCPHCGQLHISAVSNPQGNRCPQCLRWRTDEIELYEALDSQVITDPELINRKPFWICKVCEAVNEDTGVPAHLLQCGNCDSYQTSEIGGITGDPAADQQTPETVSVGEPVELRSVGAGGSAPGFDLRSRLHSGLNSRLGWLAAGLASLGLVGGGIFSQTIWSPQNKDPNRLTVQITDLRWMTEVDVQEQKTLTRQAWSQLIPLGAKTLKSETRQRGTQQQQRGSRTVLVEEQYQSGTRTETYFEPEQYQSGTRTETYFESERYQNGTRTETYSESERYQSGTKEECQTTSRGNGVGRRSCQSRAVYSTRQVQKSRSVPVYSTRQVRRTRSLPVYSTRQVQRTRSLPVYNTRQVPVEQPIFVSVPVQDTWVTYQLTEWIPKQTYRNVGRQDSSRHSPTVKLTRNPRQQISAKRETCRLLGNYSVARGWFESPEIATGDWTVPCQEYDRVNIGDRVQLQIQSNRSAKIAW
jgi:hypothetical protein